MFGILSILQPFDGLGDEIISPCFGIIVDAYGAGPFMTLTRIKGVIAAEVSDERTAYMTRSHNNARIITLGSQITGPAMAKNIVKSFAEGSYDGGRHQVRVDMLNHMGKEIMLEETE